MTPRRLIAVVAVCAAAVALTFAVVARPAPRTASAAAIPGLATGTPTMYEFSTDT